MSKDLVVKIGEYTKGGETKGEYLKIGVLLSNNNGDYILLEPTVDLAGVMMKQRILNPTKATGSVMVSIFDRDKGKAASGPQSAPAASQQKGAFDDFDDDIPF